MRPPEKASHFRSLDVFRGATIALMNLVNNAGGWGKPCAPLLHPTWHGWTPADLAAHLPDDIASLAWALTHVAIWLLVLIWMDRRRIYLKV